jgi:hypothetical protein
MNTNKLAAVLIVPSTALVVAKHLGLVGGEVPTRVAMALTGLMLAAYANAGAKAVARTARRQTGQRLAGWVFVLGGLVYAALWAFAPLEIAGPASLLVIGSGLAWVIGYCVWCRVTPA